MATSHAPIATTVVAAAARRDETRPLQHHPALADQLDLQMNRASNAYVHPVAVAAVAVVGEASFAAAVACAIVAAAVAACVVVVVVVACLRVAVHRHQQQVDDQTDVVVAVVVACRHVEAVEDDHPFASNI